MDSNAIMTVAVFILSGAKVAVQLYVVTMIFSMPLGMLCAMGKLSGFKPLVWLLEGYTWIFRGTPLLLQLYFVYFGLPMMKIPGLDTRIILAPFAAACITFVINYTAYYTEIFRGGIQTIDKGQYEAAKALGMNYGQTMRRIVFPQAVKNVIPSLGNEGVTLIKDTALCSAITLHEILRNTSAMVSKYFEIRWYFFAAVIYLVITFLIIQVFKLIEKRFSYYR